MSLSTSMRNGLRSLLVRKTFHSAHFLTNLRTFKTNLLITDSVIPLSGKMGQFEGFPKRMLYSTDQKTEQDATTTAEKDGEDQKEEAEQDKSTDAPQEQNEEEKAEEDQGPTKVEQLEAEIEESKKKLLLAYAEMENVRAIARRDVENAKTYAVQGFAKSLLDVADNLSRAIESVPEEAKDAEKYPHLMSLLEGIQMTDGQLTKVFQSNNLVKFGEVGEAFDPSLHDAMFEYEDETQSPGTIGQLMKSGYKLHDRVIRPAQVGTIKAPPTK